MSPVKRNFPFNPYEDVYELKPHHATGGTAMPPSRSRERDTIFCPAAAPSLVNPPSPAAARRVFFLI